MKKYLILFVTMALCFTSAEAQKKKQQELNIDSIVEAAKKVFPGEVTVKTADGSLVKPSKEGGFFQTHVNKTRKITGVIGKVASKVGTAGMAMIGVGAAKGNASGIRNGIKVLDKAQGAQKAADLTNMVAGKEGQDVVFAGEHSAVSINGKPGGQHHT